MTQHTGAVSEVLCMCVSAPKPFERLPVPSSPGYHRCSIDIVGLFQSYGNGGEINPSLWIDGAWISVSGRFCLTSARVRVRIRSAFWNPNGQGIRDSLMFRNPTPLSHFTVQLDVSYCISDTVKRRSGLFLAPWAGQVGRPTHV